MPSHGLPQSRQTQPFLPTPAPFNSAPPLYPPPVPTPRNTLDPCFGLSPYLRAQIRSTLSRRRLSIQPGFQEFDRKGEGHVSVGQLERVLCSYGVLPANRRTQELLAKRQGRYGGGGGGLLI